MGSITIAMKGLWVHVQQGAPAMDRVVAVSADPPPPVPQPRINPQTPAPLFPPHTCFVVADIEIMDILDQHGIHRADDPPTRSTPLRGWRITVDNPERHQGFTPPVRGHMPPHSHTPTGLLGLKDYYEPMTLQQEVTILRPPAADSAVAAVFVDIDHGTVQTLQYRSQGGYYTAWTVKTIDFPRLRFESADAAITPITVTLPDGAYLNFHNSTSHNVTDKTQDFLLNYRIAEGGIPVPDDPNFHPPHLGNMGHIATSASCSNTDYP